ncbi:MAG: protein-L-isoaspartate(D-aspartate) O-methyltransferase [Planctomycetaceae bacterium]
MRDTIGDNPTRLAARQRMLEHHLQARGLTDPAILQALKSVPREDFVNETQRDAAYEDTALPIDCGQTISQPYTVAFMCSALNLKPSDRVLEIGTGSGYGAAVLARLVTKVYSVERVPRLANSARDRLDRLGIENVEIRLGDGTLGLRDAAPFDAICVTAAAETLPDAYPQQISGGGRIVIPLGKRGRSQALVRYSRSPQELLRENLGAFRFVPLIGSHSPHASGG